MAKVNKLKHAKIQVETLPLAKLLPHPRNPRTHPGPGTPEWENLRHSLQSVYFDPLVLNKANGYLVSGHLRRKVLESMGCEQIDVVIIDVSEKEHLALLMGANNQMGKFDYPKVHKILKELERSKGQQFFHGFDEPQMEDLLKGNFDVVVEDGPGGVPPGGSTPQVLVSKLQASKHVVHAMTENEYKRLLQSIKSVGILEPLLVRKMKGGVYEIINGHQRWKAAIELAIATVPVRALSGVDDASALVRAIAANGISGAFLPTEMGKHLGGKIGNKEISAKELMEVASMDKSRVTQNTAPEGVNTKDQKKNFDTDERGVPTRKMREYVAGVDYKELKEGSVEYIELTMLLAKDKYEKVSSILNAVDKDWSAGVEIVFDFYASNNKLKSEAPEPDKVFKEAGKKKPKAK